MTASLKKSLLLALVILALGGAARVFQEQHLSVIQKNHRKLTAEAVSLGVPVDAPEQRLTKRQREQQESQALAIAAEWIALSKEIEALEKIGSRPDVATDQRIEEFLERLAALDASQHQRIIAEVRASEDISVESRRRIISASIGKIAEDHPGSALSLFLECSDLLAKDEAGKHVMTTALSGLAESNPQAAAEWLEKNAGTYGGIADDDTHREVIASIAGNDPELAFKLLGGLQLEDPTAALHAIIETGEDDPAKRDAILTELRGYLATLSDTGDRESIRSEAFEAFARNLGEESIDSVSQWLAKSKLTPEEMTSFAAGLSYSATGADTGKWIEWMASNLTEDGMEEPVKDLVGEWTQQDYQASGQWLAAAPESSAKHTAVLAYAAAVAEYEPQVAGQWAMTLPPGPVRDETLKVIYQNWPGSDPVGAAAFAREHGLE